MSASKTNAMRILDGQNVNYKILSYDHQDGKIDGMNVAEKIGKSPEAVFKTLVAHSKQLLFVFVIPVHKELDLKKAAKSAGEKKIEMLPVKELQKHTGYIRGGCSPIGMKKLYPTFIDQPAVELETIVVSAGKIGTQLELSPQDLVQLIDAQFADLAQKA
ncbi:Cys-tRNA(Pro) deacylase [Paenibacillus terrae]|uniref:Cys-tRNA(Pro)/Cys-tRNA(Cys) deacylase n=1 Tax=Paenibacillus terrae (strain HPL-003) TaxID=985665 RepID=G7VP42_PAETH|nr:Cys-tRNA(Pro) deacylase [Paenibacillus terrae]AET60919.1 ebsc family tRNA deacetylase [Paenibacillus terrae HPL-003]